MLKRVDILYYMFLKLLLHAFLFLMCALFMEAILMLHWLEKQ